jgi:SAM-dependent methyltransferase
VGVPDHPPYRAFEEVAAAPYSPIGWDAWAEDYSRLPITNVAYGFTKRLLYDVLDAEMCDRTGLDVLDFNCGSGNDFRYFLDRGHRVVGCDGSAGMLAVAARDFAADVVSGRVTLFEGRAEALAAGSFGGRRFDVVFSGTGGTAYLPDEALRQLHRGFRPLLKPGGRLIVTHLRPRCLVESLYHLAHGRPRAALLRWRSVVEVSIRSEGHRMYLRGLRDLRPLLDDVAPAHRLVPLNIVTPAFQTGIHLPPRVLPFLRRIEQGLQRLGVGLAVCDQVVWIWRNSSQPTGDGPIPKPDDHDVRERS